MRPSGIDESYLGATSDEREPPDEVERGNDDGYSVDSIGAYLGDLRRFQRLTAGDEIELAQLVAAGGAEGAAARQRMIEANLRLVVFVAKRFANRGVELLDLVSAGNIALMDAVEKFDPAKGCRFSAFAGIRIMRTINRSIGELTRTVRLPQHIADSLRSLAKARRELTQELGHDPDTDELAERMGVKPKKALQLFQVVQTTGSLDASVGDGEDELRLADIIPATNTPQEWGLVDSLAAEWKTALRIAPRVKSSRARLSEA